MAKSVACVGHNTVDKYVNQGMMYPGGNEVNVAALLSRKGIPSSYIGWVGNDIYGSLILESLKQENVDTTHCHVKDDLTTFTEIFLKNGERSFGEIRRGSSTRSRLSDDDLLFISEYDVLHTSYYSRMEQFISENKDMLISYDFTELATEKYLSKNLPFVDIAIISFEDRKNPEKLMKQYHSLGSEIIIVTMGSKGSYIYDGELYHQPAIAGNIVDTLGAGDSFIASFISEYLRGSSTTTSMSKAAEAARKTCSHFGAFGHGIAIPENG